MTGGGPALTLPAMDPVLGAFIGYLVVVVAIGVWASRFSSGGVGEGFLAGRALNSVALKVLALLSFVALALFALPFPLLIVLVALLGMWAARYRTHWLGSTPLVDNDTVPAPMSPGHVWRVLGVGLLLWALPLVLTHGWPGSTLEFMEIVDLLAHPERHGGNAIDAFDVIVPTLPGYGFSGPPMRRGGAGPIGPRAIARLWHRLMTERLNLAGPYAAQGGDWGAIQAPRPRHRAPAE